MRVGGIIDFSVDGRRYKAKGNFTYNIGAPKREGIAGADTVHGYKETVQVPFIEGEITDELDLSLEKFVMIKDATVKLELANGKLINLYQAWYAHEGTGESEEGKIPVRFEGMTAKEAKI